MDAGRRDQDINAYYRTAVHCGSDQVYLLVVPIDSAFLAQFQRKPVIFNHFRRRVQFLPIVILAVALRAYPTQSAFGVDPSKVETEIERLDKEGSRAIATCYDYDKSIPLEPRTVERSKKDNALREKIVFRGVQGFLVPAYFQLPPETDGPHPCVLLLHGWSGSKEELVGERQLHQRR